MGRVGLRHRQVRQLDLIKAVVFHRPEHIAPGPVQRIHALILLRQPIAKGLPGSTRVAEHRVMAAVFVINLPGRDMRIAAKALAHGCGHVRRCVAVAFVAVTVMAARSKDARAALGIMGQHVREAVHHPAGRGGRWRAHHDLQPSGTQHVHRTVQPVPCERAWRWLQTRPGKFPDPHPGNARLNHPGGILRPDLFRPVFGVIANPKCALHSRTCGSATPCATLRMTKVAP